MALFVASAFVGNAGAQTDVTSTYLNNADFSQGTPASVGICTYDYDREKNGTELFGLVPVAEWNCTSNENGKAGGLVAFNSGVWIGGAGYTAPNTNSDGESTGNILGLVAVWTGTAQYTQEVILPAGEYTLVVPVYNSKGGTVDFSKNLIGFIENSGTEHLATNKTYAVNSWKYEFITFTLAEETTGKISLGYTSANKGSGDMPHLFISAISLFEGQVDSEAYEAAKEAARNEKELALNKEKLSGASYATPSQDLLVNGSFDTANQGWTLSNMKYQQNGERPTRYVEQWANNTSVGTGSATQTVKNLPAGAYRLVGMANAQFQSNQSLDITGVELKINDSKYPVSGAWKEYDIVYNHQTDGDLTVAFSFESTNANWVCVDGVSLVYGGEYAAYEAAMHKGDWEAALNAAKEALNNESYSSITGSERAALVAETEKVEPTTTEGYDEARDALKSTTDAFVKAAAAYNDLETAKSEPETFVSAELPYASKAKYEAIASALEAAVNPTDAADATAKANAIRSAYRIYIESNALAEGVEGTEQIEVPDYRMEVSYDATNKAFGAWKVFGQVDGTIQLLSGETFTDGDGNANYKYADIYKKDNNAGIKQTINLAAGKYIMTVTARAASTANAGFKAFAGGVEVEIPRVGNTGGVFGRGWNDVTVEFVVNEASDVEIGVQSYNGRDLWWSATRFRLVKIADVATMSISDAQYSTFIAPFDVEIPEGVTASKITGVAENGSTLIEEAITGTIPANTPVLLYSESALTQTFYGQSTATADTYTEGLLTGVYVNTEVPVGSYVLLNKNNQVGFYEVVDAIPTVKPSRCYLTVTGSTAPMFSLERGEGTTSIEDAELTIDNVVIYDLAGRRVEKMEKGIYIVNGKKVIR